jgi:hypothetical protein
LDAASLERHKLHGSYIYIRPESYSPRFLTKIRLDGRPASPIAIVAITFVRPRPDTEIATRIVAEVPVRGAIVVGTPCIAITPIRPVVMPPLSVANFLHHTEVSLAKAQGYRLRLG